MAETIKKTTLHVYSAAAKAFVTAYPKTETSQVVDFATAVAKALEPYIKTTDAQTKLDTKLDKTGTAVKATSDASGNVITDTYETKTDAATKLSTAKSYTDTLKTSVTGGTVVAKKAEQDAAGNVISTTYATKAEVSSIPKFAIQVVTELPTSNISNTTVYLLKTGSESNNLYTEYIYVNNAWEKLGTQAMDLSGYLTKADAEKTYQKTLTFDNAPTSGSSNPVKSGGVYTAIANHNMATTAHANLLTVTSTSTAPTGMSDNGIWVELTGDSSITNAETTSY